MECRGRKEFYIAWRPSRFTLNWHIFKGKICTFSKAISQIITPNTGLVCSHLWQVYPQIINIFTTNKQPHLIQRNMLVTNYFDTMPSIIL